MSSSIEKKHNKKKFKILVVDDSEINRSILSDMLGDEFAILNASDGEEAVSIITANVNSIDLILLDIVMPKMDGFEVLALMNRYQMIESTPVIIISAETSPSYVERAYELGASDFINRPFDVRIIRRRVLNTIMLYSKQRRLVDLVADQMYEKEKNNNLLINILSHIVEFRNGESGLHVLHIHVMADILLKNLLSKTDKYELSSSDISLIATASSLHDIGKIGIPGEILNKPGKLTPEEYEIIKQHPKIGASMLDSLPIGKNEKLVKYAYEICRWHHERYDGKGYPDGLVGEEIPISAQIVSLADVYDALTSQRVYKDAFSHEEALAMIMRGECGVFNPLLLECLNDSADKLRNELTLNSYTTLSKAEMAKTVDIMLNHEELSISKKTFSLLEQERIKSQFYIEMSDEIQFEFTMEPPVLTISDIGVTRLGLDKIILDPCENKKLKTYLGEDNFKLIVDSIIEVTPENPNFKLEIKIPFCDELRWVKLIGRVIFSDGINRNISEIIGKIVDIHNERVTLKELQYKAAHDPLTQLLNHETAKKQIEEKLANNPNKNYLFVLFDLDFFKAINDNNGHRFGDDVLKYIARQLVFSLGSNDVIARVGGDEFLIFLESTTNFMTTIKYIHDALSSKFAHITISVSIGVVETKVAGRDYNELFNCADNALYDAKRQGKNRISVYNNKVEKIFSTISPIEAYTESIDTDKIDFDSLFQISQFMKQFNNLYEYARLVDVPNSIVYEINKEGKFIKQNDKCHRIWNRESRCENCISAKVLNSKKSATKFELVDNNLYLIRTLYTEVNFAPYVLELVTKIDDETLCGACNKEEFMRKIVEHNHNSYIDDFEHVFNRKYYEEQVRKLSDLYAVGMIKITNYNSVQRKYSHGDLRMALDKLIKFIFKNIRNTDIIIRYEDDCFIFVARIITEARYEQIKGAITDGLKKFNEDLTLPFQFEFVCNHGIDSVENHISVIQKELAEPKENRLE